MSTYTNETDKTMKEYNETMNKLIDEKGYAYTLGFLESVLQGQLNENELSKVRNAFLRAAGWIVGKA